MLATGQTAKGSEMGFGDKFKDLAKQAQDAVAERQGRPEGGTGRREGRR